MIMKSREIPQFPKLHILGAAFRSHSILASGTSRGGPRAAGVGDSNVYGKK